MSIPGRDIKESTSLGQRFGVYQKAGRGKPWIPVEEGITSLEYALSKAVEVQAWETGIITQSGLIYWTSHNPDLFNSTVIQYINK
ncbi:hypothetical protein BKI52_10690 [marine bacterium AO1-C]|nr:hypothetical protein BKI52_10690 [marine bacterium AO1-C]